MFATLITNVTTVVTASMSGVAAKRTPARHRARAGAGPVAARPRPAPAAGSVATWPPRPAGATGAAKSTGSSRTERRRAARGRRGRADPHAAIRIDADRLGLHARCVLHRKVHDPPLVRQHRLERHGLSACLHSGRDAARDLAELLLAAPAIALDVEGDVDSAPDPPGGDRGGDLL